MTDALRQETRRLASISPHVQLSLLRIDGPSYAMQRSERLRISLNLGPAFQATTTGPLGCGSIACGHHALLVTPPGIALDHQAEHPPGRSASPPPARLATFFVSPEMLTSCAAELAPGSGEVALSYRVVEPGTVLLPLAQALLADLLAGSPDGQAATEGLVRALVCRLLARLPHATESTPIDTPIERVCRHVEAHLQDALSLPCLARVAGMSQYHFCRVFADATGKSPHQFVLATRVEAAQRLLWSAESGGAASGQTMLDVALACGFNSSSHFSTQFRRLTGQSPRAWRSARPEGQAVSSSR